MFFGSARTLSREGAERELVKLGTDEAKKRSDYEAALKRGQKALEWSRYYEDARRLAHLLTEWSLSLEEPRRRFVVCSGGGPGIMEAANRGATEAGGKTVGLNIRLPFEQGPNPYITEGLHLEFHYFFMRKFWFAYLAKALVIFPGRVRHARRDVRDPHARPDREAVEEAVRPPLRQRVLGPDPALPAAGRVGRDQRRGSRTCSAASIPSRTRSRS